MMNFFHKHNWHLIEKIGNQSLTKDSIWGIPEHLVFICECGKVKSVEVKR